MTDAELVARARGGDTAAFGELVGRHQSAVYRAALAAVGSPADADDVAQEAFLSAYRRLNGFRGEASFKTWLLTIAWNHAINRRRSAGRWLRRLAPAKPAQEGEPEAIFDVPSVDRTPEQLAADGQLRRHIRREILRLPSKLRDALLLAQSGDYTYDEIGALVKAPTGTIKWRVSEARRRVRERLRASGYSDAG